MFLHLIMCARKFCTIQTFICCSVWLMQILTFIISGYKIIFIAITIFEIIEAKVQRDLSVSMVLIRSCTVKYTFLHYMLFWIQISVI
jgi:hypothetical protein